MSDFKSIPGGICAPKGFSAAGVHCGIRHNHSKLDLALIKADVRCAGAGCYTTNKVYGAPITVDREHLKDGYAQAIVVNSGNANTCAPNGVQLAKDTCDIVAKELGIRADDVLPSSTGVIGQAMSIEPFAKGIPEAAAKLAADEAGSHDAATAIMTTDTHPKEIALEFAVGGKAVRIGAIAKGSGMIHPNMATMLLFYTTDAKVAPAALQKALSRPSCPPPSTRLGRRRYLHERHRAAAGQRPVRRGNCRGHARLRYVCRRADRGRRASEPRAGR